MITLFDLQWLGQRRVGRRAVKNGSEEGLNRGLDIGEKPLAGFWVRAAE